MSFQEYLPYYKRNLKVAVPVMLTHAGQITVNLADNIMVGHLGTAELAAATFANSILVPGMVFGIGFSQGLTPHVGQAFGRKDYRQVGHLLQNSLILNSLLAIVMTIIMYACGHFMNRMGQPADIVGMARGYYNIQLFSIFPFLLFFGARQFSEGIGITKYAMYITLFANAINIFLNWVLIYGKLGFPAYGVNGASIATLVSRVVMLICFILIYIRKEVYNRYFAYFTRKLGDLDKMKKILQTSVPLSIQTLVEITSFSMSAIMVGWLGKVPLASHQVAMSMSSFSFMLALGVGAAATIRVSHQYGSGNYRAMRMAGFAAVHLSVALMSISGIAYMLFNWQIPHLFTVDPAVIKLSASLLIISAMFQIFDAMQLSGLACLRALADVRKPLLFSVLSYYFVCLPLGYLLGFVFGLGAIGVWIGLMLGLIFAAILFLNRFNKLSLRIIRQNEQGEGN
jgi:MATE family multidrug resistance protein